MSNCQRKNRIAWNACVFAGVLFFTCICIALNVSGGIQAEAKEPYADPGTDYVQELCAVASPSVSVSPNPKDEAVVEMEPVALAEEPELPYTEDDVIALAKMAYGEAFITRSDTEISACMWCACNRLDSGDSHYNGCESVYDIVTQKYQFYGYRENNPVDEHLVWLARDVLDRWAAERNGVTDVGRTLPKGYCFFWGDGLHNHFTTENMGGIKYDWSLPSPYSS